jgi:hypothetical protein
MVGLAKAKGAIDRLRKKGVRRRQTATFGA